MEDKNFEDEDLKDIQDTDKAVQGSQDKDKVAHGSSDNADNYEKICYMCGRSPGSIYILVQNNSLPAAQTYLEPYQEYSPDGLCPHTALEWNLKVPQCMDVHYDK